MTSRNYKCPLCANEVELIDFQSSGPVQCYFCDGHFRVPPISSLEPNFDYVRQSQRPQSPVIQSASHLPYCHQCRTAVNPNVLSINESSGGVILPTAIGAVYKANSYTRLVKVCPHCGNEVFSAQDLVQQEADSRFGMYYAIFWVVFFVVVIAFLIWVCNRPTS
jgi:DNA-directed RNA polymerase subunit RPC12/RpoP